MGNVVDLTKYKLLKRLLKCHAIVAAKMDTLVIIKELLNAESIHHIDVNIGKEAICKEVADRDLLSSALLICDLRRIK